MATESSFLGHPGPYGGMSGLPSAGQRPGTASISINVDTSRGAIQAREGYGVVNQHYGERITGIGTVTAHDGCTYIGATYWKNSDNTVRFRAFRTDGTEMNSHILSAIPYGIPPNHDDHPSMKEAFGKLYIAFPRGRLLSFDPNRPRMGPKPVVAKAGTGRAFIPYAETIPAAACVEMHHRRLWIAGFDGETPISSSIELPDDQNLVSEDLVTASRTGVIPPRNGLMHSNLDMPEAFTFDNFMWVPFAGERVRGLASTVAGMLVLGEHTTCLVTGTPGQYVVQTLSQDVGCVSPASVVHGRGIVCWMATDGFYAFDGSGITRISDDIGDMFRPGGWREPPLRSLGVVAANHFHPFLIARSRLREASGAWDPVRQLFFWAVPMSGEVTPKHMACLVYNPMVGAWSFWSADTTTTSGFYPTAFTTIYENGETSLYFGTTNGQVSIYGKDPLDKIDDIQAGGARVTGKLRQVDNDLAANRSGFDWMWMTPRLEASQNISVAVKSIRIRQLATGAAGARPPTFHIDTERAFDQSGGQLSETGVLAASPSAGPPSPTTPYHYWGKGTWSSGTAPFNWAMPDIWKARYNVSGQTVGHTFRIALNETVADDAGRVEIHDIELEVQPKRDLT